MVSVGNGCGQRDSQLFNEGTVNMHTGNFRKANDEIIKGMGKYTIRLGKDGGSFSLSAGSGKPPLLSADKSYFLIPVVGNRPVQLKEIRLKAENEFIITVEATASNTLIHSLKTQIHLFPEHIEIETVYRASSSHRLGGWQLFPENTFHSFFYLERLWWRPEIENNFIKETFDGGKIISTEPANQSYYPVLPIFSFNKWPVSLLTAFSNLTGGFGMKLRADREKIENFYLDTGGKNGYPVEAKEIVKSPRFIMMLNSRKPIEEAYRKYTDLV